MYVWTEESTIASTDAAPTVTLAQVVGLSPMLAKIAVPVTALSTTTEIPRSWPRRVSRCE